MRSWVSRQSKNVNKASQILLRRAPVYTLAGGRHCHDNHQILLCCVNSRRRASSPWQPPDSTPSCPGVNSRRRASSPWLQVYSAAMSTQHPRRPAVMWSRCGMSQLCASYHIIRSHINVTSTWDGCLRLPHRPGLLTPAAAESIVNLRMSLLRFITTSHKHTLTITSLHIYPLWPYLTLLSSPVLSSPRFVSEPLLSPPLLVSPHTLLLMDEDSLV